jgi:glycosyltransferase involved in cell wall biosynthesis
MMDHDNRPVPGALRVLHVTHQYPPAIGGSEKYIADLSEELTSRGHWIDVYTSRSVDYNQWKNELDARERMNGVDVYRFRSMRRTRFVWRVLSWSLERYWKSRSRWLEPLIWFGGGPLCPGMFAGLLTHLPRYDLVHLNCLVYSHIAYGYLAARLRHVPVVVTPHVHVDQACTYNVGYQLDVLRGAEHVLADTAGERDFLLELGLEPQRITVAGVGLQAEDYPARGQIECRQQLGLAEDAFVVLFLGRQVEYKGLEAALEASIALRNRYPQLVLLAVGPETDYSRRLFASYRNRAGILNLGAVPDETRLAALNACDCLVLPSAGEAFGIVFLEAWVVGKPVIGPRTPAVAAVVQDGEDGWLVRPGDSWAIVEAVERWIKAPELAAQMGDSGRRKVLSRYTCARIADIVERVYARTVHACVRAGPDMDGCRSGLR